MLELMCLTDLNPRHLQLVSHGQEKRGFCSILIVYMFGWDLLGQNSLI